MTQAFARRTSPLDGELCYRFARALLAMDASGARSLLEVAGRDRSRVQVIEAVVAPALESLGIAWEAGDIALSQVYVGGRLCEELIDSLLPDTGLRDESQARIAIATLDDYHLLGKRIVRTALRASGFLVRDYGRVTAEEVVRRAQEDQLEVLLLSTLMLPGALRVKEVRARMTQAGLTTRLAVGGAPFRLDPKLAREVGADAFGKNSAEAIAIVRRLLQRSP